MTGNDHLRQETMGSMDDHGKPTARRDHLWVLLVIAACALLELVASWVTIGAMSGFPRIGGKHGLPTDWVLAVTAEAFWGYALWAWLAGSAGRRSRRFAMWSAAVVFTLSLVGQGAAHLVTPGVKPPAALVVFITDLPVLVVALIAILIHLRQLDREEAERDERVRAEAGQQAAIERAEADERTALRTQLSALAERLEEAELARTEAEQRAAQAEARTAQLERTLAAQKDAKSARKTRARNGASARRSTRATADSGDIDARTKALNILSDQPDISGAELGVAAGMSKRWGQIHRDELATLAAGLAEAEGAAGEE